MGEGREDTFLFLTSFLVSFKKTKIIKRWPYIDHIYPVHACDTSKGSTAVMIEVR